MSVINCQDKIIGFTRKHPDMDGYEAEYSVSESGLFVDELQGLSLIHTCPHDVWEMLKRARDLAWTALRQDLAMHIGKYVKPKRNQSTGDIAAIQFNGLHSAKTYAGLRLYSVVTGGKMILRGFTLLPSHTGLTEVAIVNDYEVLHIETVNAVAKKPIKVLFALPMEIELAGNIYIVYETAGNIYRNKLICGGCTHHKWCFDTEKPCLSQSKEYWTEWVMAGGIEADDLDPDVLLNASVLNRANGLVLHASFVCDEDKILCSDVSDFRNNNTDRAVAFALWYKTGEFFLNEITGTGEINRYTLLGHDAINHNISFYMERYMQLLDFIAKTVDLSRTDCFSCNPKSVYRNTSGVQWT